MKKKRRRTIADALTGRWLNGICIDRDRGALYLRCADVRITIDLEARVWKRGAETGYWLTFPGLLRITRVLEDRAQIVLIVSGALFSSRIAVRKKTDWRIVFDANFV